MKEGTPAQKRAWAKSRNNPSRKQLAARRRFAAMSRANAKARRAAIRSVSDRSHSKPGRSRKMAKNATYLRDTKGKFIKKHPSVLRKRGKGKIDQLRKKSAYHFVGKSGSYGRRIPPNVETKPRGKGSKAHRRSKKSWTDVGYHKVKSWTERYPSSRRLPNPNQKHNTAVDQVFKTFVGRDSHSIATIDFPDGSPTNLARLGVLTELVSETETFKFQESERVYLASDARGNLYVGGNQQRVEPNTNFGHLLKIAYVCKKAHIESGKTIEYVHRFGDEGGKRPRLRSDAEGRFLISGGAYTITSAGIAD